MAYVDLNPIRAKMAKTLEQSDHTSVKTRLEATVVWKPQPRTLFPFVGNEREHMPEGLPFKLTDYLDLVEWFGRMIREDKRGAIAASTPPLLQRLQIDPENWKTLTTQFERSFKTFVGEPKTLTNATLSLGYQRSPGLSACRALLQ